MATAPEPKINSQEDLEGWLDDKPVEWAQAIAARAALRVFPLVLPVAFREGGENLILQSFRASFISWAARKYPAHDMITPAFASATPAVAAATPAVAAATAAFASANAAFASADVNAVASATATAADAAAKAAAFADASDASANIWRAISEDCRWLLDSKNASLIDQQLWFIDVRENDKYAANLPPWARKPLDHFVNSDRISTSSRRVVGGWYRAIIANMRKTPRSLFGERVDIEIASLPDEFWAVSEDRTAFKILDDIVGIAEQIPPAQPPSSDGEAPSPTPERNNRDTESDFLPDHPDAMVDHLGRSEIAFQLAGRINQIWDSQNGEPASKHGLRYYLSRLWTGMEAKNWDATLDTGFVVHIDARWGGGKTNFAAYVTRILNPWRDANMPKWLSKLALPEDEDWMERYRRPWLVVNFNAWKHQHVDPPWWVFSETIRRQCMKSLWKETNQRTTGAFPDPLPAYDYGVGPAHLLRNISLWLAERVWRMQIGSALLPLGVAALTFAAVYAMYRIGWVTEKEDKLIFFGDLSAFTLAALASLFGGVASIRGVIDYLAKNLFSGTPAAAQQFELGSADPLERFRVHFARTIEAFGRPVVVVVDDLDRCDHEYVVGLVRGMQTVMVSPRVVYLLLGDRDWIEKAFAETHKPMAAIDVGPEHSFGGRFVEKAIQMSFALPEMDEKRRAGFTEAILRKPERKDKSQKTADEALPPGNAGLEFDREISEKIDRILRQRNFRDREEAAKSFVEEVRGSDLPAETKAAFETDFVTRLARRGATDRSAETETSHMLVGLAPMLPGNPRQIKRIINTVTVMQQVARTRDEEFWPDADDIKWQKLARWVVVMIEWPQSWYTLTLNPGIMEWMPTQAGKTPETPEDETLSAYAALISAKESVKKLLLMTAPADGWAAEPITPADIVWLAGVMPATSGSLLPLPSKEQKKETKD
ncbi:P-loop NTPase fold protein [Oricola indica]|uniref:P-loop NTPase fold protein n=1 Tax=Oricola indica TaxID=2872591 RepID=UPI003CCC0C96